ncbi:type I restriction-modification system M subunit [Aeromonas salmonicida]|uniref:class I SAM-dependent DNA methyltransferase n=1 Tax=Aeromonas salmonicida TaxID=645 RepID=UPI0010255624|nr:type I restriction-modification system subunit M [Aeromonas salmonicida]VFB09234.1 type I restriction-modification system M subunit [Aeromonas salmonicida]
MSNNDIVQKLWNLCDVLRDDGINYSDYVTELVLLLFIKMVNENEEAGILAVHTLPEQCRWPELASRSGINLLNHYRQMLVDLSKDHDPLIAAIYADAQTRLREPRHLEQMIKTLDQIDWFNAKQDGLGDLYEGLLEKNAGETKSGAGQYFTPRALINSMVRCLQPKAGEVIQDPAAGTAGFLIAADQYIKSQTDDLYNLDKAGKAFQKNRAFIGVELVPNTRRLALMNCLLHGMEGDDEGVVHLGNALGQAGAALPKVDIILANPPFGTSKGGEASNTRDDLTYKTSNKQLAFLQHIYRGLKPGGRAAVVLPDNVLFEAGVGTEVRRDLMDKCNLHTILRLPTGIFYAQGVKTNVLFFQKGSANDPYQQESCTKAVWVYDLRSNMPSFGKRTPFSEAHLTPFEQVYGTDPHGQSPRIEGEYSFTELAESATEQNSDPEQGRWRSFSREWIRDNKGDSLDISWLKDQNSIDAADLPEPAILAGEAMSELSSALYEMHSLLKELNMPFFANRKLVELGKQFGISKQAARKENKERESE